jgi:beta-glucosidase
LVGYRWYDAKGIQPLFPFGYGLSYTNFAYKDLKVSPPTEDMNVTVEFAVKNTGDCTGAEVAQLYVSFPPIPDAPEPPRQLKGFRRVELIAGASAQVKITLDSRSFSHWDSTSHSWRVTPGTYIVSAAASSRDIRLSAACDIK